MNEIVFEITQEGDGGFCAECLTESIFTQGDTWGELRANVKEAWKPSISTVRSQAASAYIWLGRLCRLPNLQR